MYLPLQFYLPKPKVGRPDPLAPLGISFEDTLREKKPDLNLEDEIAWLKQNLVCHPMIGPVSEAEQATIPVVPPRQSVGGTRASDLAAQFEEASSYPASETYLPTNDDDISLVDMPR